MTWQEKTLTATCKNRQRWRGNFFQREGKTFSTDGVRLLMVDGAWMSGSEPSRGAPPVDNVLQGPKAIGTLSLRELREWCVGVQVEYVCTECGQSLTEKPPEPTECEACDGDGECPHCGHDCSECDGTGFREEGCAEHGEDRKLRETNDGRHVGTINGLTLDRRLFVDIVPHLPGDKAKVALTECSARFDGEGWTFVVMGIAGAVQPGPELSCHV